jgi:hypothetical protein
MYGFAACEFDYGTAVDGLSPAERAVDSAVK